MLPGRVWVGDFVVEEAREDEGDAGRPCAADVSEDAIEAAEGDGGGVAEEEEAGGEEGEAEVGKVFFLLR